MMEQIFYQWQLYVLIFILIAVFWKKDGKEGCEMRCINDEGRPYMECLDLCGRGKSL